MLISQHTTVSVAFAVVEGRVVPSVQVYQAWSMVKMGHLAAQVHNKPIRGQDQHSLDM